MADSPLELYEKAYRLHYDSKNVAGACDLYEQIIRGFPESNESGYAVIQLEKIKSNKALDSIHNEPAPSGTSPLQIVSLALNLIAAVMLIAAFVVYTKSRAADRQRIDELSSALSSMQAAQVIAAPVARRRAPPPVVAQEEAPVEEVQEAPPVAAEPEEKPAPRRAAARSTPKSKAPAKASTAKDSVSFF